MTVAPRLPSRRFGAEPPEFVAASAGGTLWALLVYLLATAIALSAAVSRHALAAIVLLSGFLWSGFACYAAGVAFGAAAEAIVARATPRSSKYSSPRYHPAQRMAMLENLLAPIVSAQFLTLVLLAILFLQSGLDKVIDFKGNLSWLKGHFAKSPLAGRVTPMLGVITLTETAAGALAAIGAVTLALDGSKTLGLHAAQLCALNIVMLFFGQRLAKDYAGAASLVPYFILSVGAIVLMAQ